MISTYDDLLESVCEASTDEEAWEVMGILADFLEEQGDCRYIGWREIVKNRKMPYAFVEENEWASVGEKDRYGWGFDEFLTGEADINSCVLPYSMMDMMTGFPPVYSGAALEYWTKREALEDLVNVYAGTVGSEWDEDCC